MLYRQAYTNVYLSFVLLNGPIPQVLPQYRGAHSTLVPVLRFTYCLSLTLKTWLENTRLSRRAKYFFYQQAISPLSGICVLTVVITNMSSNGSQNSFCAIKNGSAVHCILLYDTVPSIIFMVFGGVAVSELKSFGNFKLSSARPRHPNICIYKQKPQPGP